LQTPANYERTLISVRTREGLQSRKQRGETYCRWAEYGRRWEKHFDSQLQKHVIRRTTAIRF
jgi:hypothetical protein